MDIQLKNIPTCKPWTETFAVQAHGTSKRKAGLTQDEIVMGLIFNQHHNSRSLLFSLLFSVKSSAVYLPGL